MKETILVVSLIIFSLYGIVDLIHLGWSPYPRKHQVSRPVDLGDFIIHWAIAVWIVYALWG